MGGIESAISELLAEATELVKRKEALEAELTRVVTRLVEIQGARKELGRLTGIDEPAEPSDKIIVEKIS